jgi:hypothetical protein
MSLEELINIERVQIASTNTMLQETYSIENLRLSKLFEEVLKELEMSVIPILDVRILLYSLKSVPFTDEVKGSLILEELTTCIRNELYGLSKSWDCEKILSELQKLRNLILYDYILDGSIVIYYYNKIEWDLDVCFL